MNGEERKEVAAPVWGHQFQAEKTSAWKPMKQQRQHSANLVVDLWNTTVMLASITDTPVLSGSLIVNGSGAATIGQTCDLLNANTYCNVFAGGNTASGRLRLQVQTSDQDVSGTFTDPTSGLPNLPGAWQSGGILWLNSGLDGGLFGPFTSGQCITSGFFVAQGFQRPGRYARVNVLLEAGPQYAGGLTAGFVTQLKTTGSGGGFSFQPTSGPVNV